MIIYFYALLIKPGERQPARLVLEITFTVRVYVYVCVHAPEAIKTSGVILALYDWLNNSGCFSVPFYESCHRCYQ